MSIVIFFFAFTDKTCKYKKNVSAVSVFAFFICLDVRLGDPLGTDDITHLLTTVAFEPTKWIRKEPFDADGYFLLQLAEKIGFEDQEKLFLTADGTSSLTIRGMF